MLLRPALVLGSLLGGAAARCVTRSSVASPSSPSLVLSDVSTTPIFTPSLTPTPVSSTLLSLTTPPSSSTPESTSTPELSSTPTSTPEASSTSVSSDVITPTPSLTTFVTSATSTSVAPTSSAVLCIENRGKSMLSSYASP
ncbi:unnamed protein product, partial [Clonostachys chloroleuca]